MKLVSRIIRLPFKLIPENTILPIFFGCNRGFYWIKGSGVNSMWLGTYEKEKQIAISRLVKKSVMVCYDIGAHVGFYSLLFSRLTGNNGFVYAFEPLPRNIEFLKKHLEINKIKNVKIIEAAVSESSGSVKLKISDDSFTSKIIDKNVVRDFLEVKKISIDEEVESKNILPPNIVKIDVEGHEFAVLKGMAKTISKYKPIIFVALDNSQTKEKVFNFLKNSGYEICNLHFKKVENLYKIYKINEIVAKL